MKKIILVCSILAIAGTVQAQTRKAAPKSKKKTVVVEPVQERLYPGPVEVAPAREEDKIFTAVEQTPEFPGGTAAMQQYLAQNIRYPQAAKTNGVQGRVIVRFVVRSTGEVTDVVVMRDIGDGCGEEAKRVVRAMPKWKPGKQNGISVNVLYNVPVHFSLGPDEKEIAPDPATEHR